MLTAGFLLLLFGSVLLLHSGLPIWAKVIALALWLTEGGRSIAIQARAFAGIRFLRIACDGRIDVLGPGGTVRRARLLPGSRVGPALAWLRFEWADGKTCGGLLRPDDAGPDGWRRLQVAWRYGRARP